VVSSSSLGCALHLYRFSRGKTRPVPVITLVIIGSTALVTSQRFQELDKSVFSRSVRFSFLKLL
jgi:hypothetical protein